MSSNFANITILMKAHEKPGVKMEPGIVLDQLVGKALESARKKANLNQQQAADGIEVSASSLSRLERGDYSLTVSQLFQLAHRYGVPPSDIIDDVAKAKMRAESEGIRVDFQKKSNSDLLLLGAAALAAFFLMRK